MIQNDTIEEMYNCLESGDLKGFEVLLNIYLKKTKDLIACQELAMFLVNIYNASRSGFVAKLLEIIIRCKPKLAITNYPENHFFKIIMVTGSMEMFECYIEEAIEPHVKNAGKVEQEDYYKKLLELAALLNKMFIDQYETVIKGRNFNGAFASDESNQKIKLIHQEDYEIMNDIVDKYNTIVGRRDIIKVLINKAGLEF
jgi:hypothetical protein